MNQIKYILKNSHLFLMVVMFLGTGFITGCNDLLDAENPNNVVESDLEDPRSALPLVNGSLAVLTRAVANIYAPYSTTSDELIWIGSRDAWQQLQFGDLANPSNEFTDAAFFFVGETRWWSDDVIGRLEDFDEAGTLVVRPLLASAYLYGAIAYVTIADMFDEFAISDRQTSGAPISRAEMVQFYDRAIEYLNLGLQIENITNQQEANLRGMLARAQHARALHSVVMPPVSTGMNGIVTSPEIIAAAQAALTAMNATASDYRFQLELDGSTPGTLADGDGLGLTMPQQVNDRLEMRLSDDYVISDGTTVANISDGDPATSISLNDPIDDIPDPALYRTVLEFTVAGQFADFTIISEREIHLILAEAALAGGDTGKTFTEHINDLRALNSELSPYAGQIPELDMLLHARRVNLYLQGRRLSDHYRFDSPSSQWTDNSTAVNVPGSLFPITITEIRANDNLN